MSNGQIQCAEWQGTFILKFLGDVRLTLCPALDDAIDRIFADSNLSNIVIDLTESVNLDSTTLGLLAKLSILTRQKVGLLPTLVTTHPDINRVLYSMGFAQVFNIVEQAVLPADSLIALPYQDVDEAEVRATVLEAHRILMSLNESNREAFHDLVCALEQP